MEIGVFNGHIFFRIKGCFKIAVDPKFAFDKFRIISKLILNPYNLYNKYFEATSDDFFLKDAATILAGRKIDVAFVDGMHEYAYALNDIENCLKYLDENGVIIVHDCSPLTKESSASFDQFCSNNSDGSSTWNGDVWKAILHLRSRNDINIFVLDCDHGLGVITKGKPEQTLNYSKSEIDNLTYDDLDANRLSWLNLKRPEYLYDFFKITP